MNVYRMLEKLAEAGLASEQDRVAAIEVIHKLRDINAFGSAAAAIESDTKESVHVHRKMTEWSKMDAGKLIDVCGDCGEKLSPPYDPRYTGGNSTYFRR